MAPKTLQQWLLTLQHADPKELFGLNPQQRYRKLAQKFHPDHNPGQPDLAGQVFALLKQLYEGLSGSSAGSAGPTTINSGKDTFTIQQPLAAGEFSDLYYATGKTGQPVILKIAREASSNTFLTNETVVLSTLNPIAEGLADTLPNLKTSFKLSGRTVQVFERPKQNLVSFEQIRQAYPAGLDLRDSIWMWKRALGTLGLAHSQRFVHGAVLPHHLLISPKDHGCHICGWTCARKVNENLRARLISYTDFYPPEAPLASLQLDLYMLAKSVLYITDPRTIPIGLRRLLDLCLDKPERRPRDTWAFHNLLDLVARETFGLPKFREFCLP